jgi:hypothetical protein
MSGITEIDNAVLIRRHENLIHALRELEEPEFSAAIRETMRGFAAAGMATFESQQTVPEPEAVLDMA